MRFKLLEVSKRHLEYGSKLVIYDDGAGILDILQRADRLKLQGTARRFLGSFGAICEINPHLIEDGHLPASDVKVIVRHGSISSPLESDAPLNVALS